MFGSVRGRVASLKSQSFLNKIIVVCANQKVNASSLQSSATGFPGSFSPTDNSLFAQFSEKRLPKNANYRASTVRYFSTQWVYDNDTQTCELFAKVWTVNSVFNE